MPSAEELEEWIQTHGGMKSIDPTINWEQIEKDFKEGKICTVQMRHAKKSLPLRDDSEVVFSKTLQEAIETGNWTDEAIDELDNFINN